MVVSRCLIAVLLLSIFCLPKISAQNEPVEEAEPFSLFTQLLKPTKPAPIHRLFFEWEPSSGLYISMPAFIASTSDLRPLLYFKDIIKAALPVVPVTIVLNIETKRFNRLHMADFLPEQHARLFHQQCQLGGYRSLHAGPPSAGTDVPAHPDGPAANFPRRRGLHTGWMWEPFSIAGNPSSKRRGNGGIE